MAKAVREATLVRDPSEDTGTFGILKIGMFSCYSLELPWRNNAQEISCIPPGKYKCRMINSPKFGYVYEVCEVPNRTHILFHSGNTAGDVSLGLKSDSNGCILVGNAIGDIDGQRALLNSKDALKRFMSEAGGEFFLLSIL